MFYILHGEDEFSRSEEIARMRAKMGDPQFADLNTTVLEGRSLTLAELRHHADAVPFLTEKRLVLVEGLLARLNPRQRKKEAEDDAAPEVEPDPELAAGLAGYLPNLPETTRLVFIEPKTLAKNNPILKLAEKDKQGARVRHFLPPDKRELAHWITERAESKDIRIDFSAANDLAIYIGQDLRALDNELEKLLAYRQGETIRREDVHAIVAAVEEQSVFDLVDALGKRETKQALVLLHDQFDHGKAPLELFPMIVRQYRILLQVRDLASRGLKESEIRTKLGLHPFVVPKMLEQARNYSIDQLEAIYEKLVDVDLALKTSRGDPAVNLDVLCVELTRMR
ncbi:MAG: DNA polymerase III subunit delta [Deltaproteobacteria bacterium]